MRSLIVYTDYKSPYAFVAKDLIYRLAEETGAQLDWRPYTLDIPSYLGSAELDSEGRVIAEARTAYQWRKVRYAYMDCRREANRRGLIPHGGGVATTGFPGAQPGSGTFPRVSGMNPQGR